MASFTEKTPPAFNGKTDDFSKWKWKYDIWKNITDVDKKKIGSLIILRLDDSTQDTVLEALAGKDIKN